MGGIGSHLKVSQVDQSVCLGNELNNLSARKDFLLKNIKSSHPTLPKPKRSELPHIYIWAGPVTETSREITLPLLVINGRPFLCPLAFSPSPDRPRGGNDPRVGLTPFTKHRLGGDNQPWLMQCFSHLTASHPLVSASTQLAQCTKKTRCLVLQWKMLEGWFVEAAKCAIYETRLVQGGTRGAPEARVMARVCLHATLVTSLVMIAHKAVLD